eukprot:8807734-Pyramimonas_sp.AAC.2
MHTVSLVTERCECVRCACRRPQPLHSHDIAGRDSLDTGRSSPGPGPFCTLSQPGGGGGAGSGRAGHRDVDV